MSNELHILAGLIVTPDDVLENHVIVIKNEQIAKLYPLERNHNKINLDLSDFVIYPGLINAHDHLLGSYFPRVGDRKPYLNWKPWDDDLKNSPIYAERGKNENIDLYYLGSYRNLLSGALTVSDHIPHFINDPFIPLMPIRVLKEYSLAHEVSNFDLKWGDGVEIEYQKAVKNNEPFITHIEEGFDEESMKGIDYLLDMKALGEHTVLIHGIALSDEDIYHMAKHKANLVWCPFSNFYMFQRTARVKELIDAGVNVSIGTDSPMSGSLNILEEMKFAKKVYRDMYKQEISDDILIKMVTSHPAKALRLESELGSISEGKKGDFIAIRYKSNNPYSPLIEAELENISLIFYKGKPLYGDYEFNDIFKKFKMQTSNFLLNKIRKVISGPNPVNLLQKIQDAVGYPKDIPFLPVS